MCVLCLLFCTRLTMVCIYTCVLLCAAPRSRRNDIMFEFYSRVLYREIISSHFNLETYCRLVLCYTKQVWVTDYGATVIIHTLDLSKISSYSFLQDLPRGALQNIF